MECPRLRDILIEYAEGNLPEEAREAVRDHLARCPACAARFEALEAERRALGELPRLHAPAGFLDAVRDRVEHPSLLRRIRDALAVPVGTRRFFQVAGSLAVAVLVFATVRTVYRGGEAPQLQHLAPLYKAETAPAVPKSLTADAAKPSETPPVSPGRGGETVREMRVTEPSPSAVPAPPPQGEGKMDAEGVRMAAVPSGKEKAPARLAESSAPSASALPADKDLSAGAAPVKDAASSPAPALVPGSSPPQAPETAIGAGKAESYESTAAGAPAPAPEPPRQASKRLASAPPATKEEASVPPPAPAARPGAAKPRARAESRSLAASAVPPALERENSSAGGSVAATAEPSKTILTLSLRIPPAQADRAETKAPGGANNAPESNKGLVGSLFSLGSKSAPPPSPAQQARESASPVAEAVQAVEDLVARCGGDVVFLKRMKTGTEAVPDRTLAVEIPVERYADFIDRLKGLGRLDSVPPEPARHGPGAVVVIDIRFYSSKK